MKVWSVVAQRAARFGALSAVFIAATAGCGRVRSIRDLSSPVYEWEVEHNGCGKSLVADSHADLWLEEGCEGKSTGLHLVRHLTDADMMRIVASFEGLPEREPLVCQEGANAHMFFRKKGDIASVWHVCLPPDVPLQAPFSTIAFAFGSKDGIH